MILRRLYCGMDMTGTPLWDVAVSRRSLAMNFHREPLPNPHAEMCNFAQ